MSKKVSIIDYDMGNLFSVLRAFDRYEADVSLITSPEEVKDADYLILPGVGAFKDGMAVLTDKGFADAINNYVSTGKPFMGICLGMQMMLDESSEFGHTQGLGLIAGTVDKIADTTIDGQLHKIPHIGWSELVVPENSGEFFDSSSILCDIKPGTNAYFVHSFAASPKDPTHRLADTLYNGRRISAAIRKDNMVGCQYHPEKSGPEGLKMIQKFLGL